jgi:hypothetical protein
MIKDFCWINADHVGLDKLVHDIERAYMEASVAGFTNLFATLESDASGKVRLYVKGNKE